MKQNFAALLTLAMTLTLASCTVSAGGASEPDSLPAASVPAESASQPEEPDHSHPPTAGDNIVPHEDIGYCGNTITKVSPEPRTSGEDWKASFWGSDSVALTDLLLYLDYQEGICRCLPEYMVETEFSEEPYGISLTEGYARHGDSQVDLTQEQMELIREILDRNLPGSRTD